VFPKSGKNLPQVNFGKAKRVNRSENLGRNRGGDGINAKSQRRRDAKENKTIPSLYALRYFRPHLENACAVAETDGTDYSLY
jgi:hypothetical protein